jgi:Fic family protein
MQANELVSQADGLKAEMDKLRPLKPEVERRIMQKFRLDWNYHSNAIEGNSLTLGETRAFLLEGLTANGKPMKDHLDIKGHDDLITFLELFIQRKEILTEAAIREMHKILLKEPYETDAVTTDGRIVKKKVQLGVYKTEPNFVRMKSGEIHQYILPEDVPAKMASLVEWHRQQDAKNDLHPLFHAALFHHQFSLIHPFDDGNGRMARILMNLILMRSGFPPVVIKLQNREPYIAALRRADAGENEAIVSFIGQNLIDAESLYLRGAKGESIEDFDDVDKAVALLKKELQGIPSPVELTKAGQDKFMKEHLQPLLVRLDTKLAQFDDLFTSNQIDIQFRDAQNFRGNQFKRGVIGEEIVNLKTWNNTTIIQLTITFNWNGFIKGKNPFSVTAGFSLQFNQRSYLFNCSNPPFNKEFKYDSWFNDDELKSFISAVTKMVLDTIQQNIKNSPKW